MASSSSGAAAPPSWNSNFIGRKIVTGPLNDVGLSLVVTDLRAAKACDDSVRCNVEFGDRWVQYSKARLLFHRCRLMKIKQVNWLALELIGGKNKVGLISRIELYVADIGRLHCSGSISQI